MTHLEMHNCVILPRLILQWTRVRTFLPLTIVKSDIFGDVGLNSFVDHLGVVPVRVVWQY